MKIANQCLSHRCSRENSILVIYLKINEFSFSSGYPAPAVPNEELFSRVTALEETTKSQSVEITLLKSALADVLTKLNAQEEEIKSIGAMKTPTKSKRTFLLLCVCVSCRFTWMWVLAPPFVMISKRGQLIKN